MKIKITIEYDPAWHEDVIADPAAVGEALHCERDDWIQGHIGLHDLDPSEFKFEVIP
jgi:hypothetical protein